MFTRLNHSLFCFCCRAVEDLVVLKLNWFQGGRASPFDYALLAKIHQRVMAKLKTMRANTGPTNAVVAAIGLHNDKVAMLPYDPAWPGLFAAEAARMQAHLGALAVEIHHTGSTSIPGLPAKPILDMAICVEPATLEQGMPDFITRMGQLGYRYLGDWKKRGGHFFEKSTGLIRTHAVQVHPVNGRIIRRLLRFRQMLRTQPELLQEYAGIKTTLAETLASQRGAYQWYKMHWLDELMLEETGPYAWGTWWLSACYPTMLKGLRRSLIRLFTRGRHGEHPMAP